MSSCDFFEIRLVEYLNASLCGLRRITISEYGSRRLNYRSKFHYFTRFFGYAAFGKRYPVCNDNVARLRSIFRFRIISPGHIPADNLRHKCSIPSIIKRARIPREKRRIRQSDITIKSLINIRRRRLIIISGNLPDWRNLCKTNKTAGSFAN